LPETGAKEPAFALPKVTELKVLPFVLNRNVLELSDTTRGLKIAPSPEWCVTGVKKRPDSRQRHGILEVEVKDFKAIYLVIPVLVGAGGPIGNAKSPKIWRLSVYLARKVVLICSSLISWELSHLVMRYIDYQQERLVVFQKMGSVVQKMQGVVQKMRQTQMSLGVR
jgi:hypothetical protein